MLAPRVLAGFHLKEKMLVLQFVLILSKLQGLAVRATGWAGGLPCSPPLPPAVFGNRKSYHVSYMFINISCTAP